MDMKRMRRQWPVADPEDGGASSASTLVAATEKKPPRIARMRSATLLILLLLFSLFLLVAVFSGDQWNLPLDRLRPAKYGTLEETAKDLANGSIPSFVAAKDNLLHGLLAAGFYYQSCLSRYQSVFFRKESSHLPSPYLLKKLRKYESLHKKCGPNTQFYNQSVEQLKPDKGSGPAECKYVVWISYSGLGNRMLSISSAFLYALLTNRVLLVDKGSDMGELFCEPFPESSWILPTDFPIRDFTDFDIKTPTSYGNMLQRKVIGNHAHGASSTGSLPAYTYLHLSHDYNKFDKLFFCEDDQRVLGDIPWLLLRSNNYFVPSLFLVPTYEEELRKLFPAKDTVFHHLGHYLFHPTNDVWGLITRYYRSYLAKADERVGIQVRVFEEGTGPFQHVLHQILSCCLKEKLLPDFSAQELAAATVLSPNARSIAVLMTSLESGYYEKIRNMYWELPTLHGEIISVYQPSYEGHQQTEKQTHNMRALAEIYLLSMTDTLVTSAWSTFGYVAQGLGGLRPWILLKSGNQTAPDPPCRRAMSIEPCFHAPPFYDCKAKKGIDTGILVPHVRHCEDISWGLKVVNQDEW